MDKKRRGIVQWLTGLFLSLWGFAFVGAVASYLKPPSTPRSAGLNILSAGRASELLAGNARFLQHGNSPIYVIRLANGEVVAVSAICTHFRCVLNWKREDSTLVCPCHRGVFNSVGEVMSGLPSRSLRSFDVEIRRGEILVHV